MDTILLNLSDAKVHVCTSLFKNHKFSVVMLVVDSYIESYTESTAPMTIDLELTLAEWKTLECLLEGRILETHLSQELYTKASKYGFTSDAVHFLEQDKNHSLSKKANKVDLFVHGHGSKVLIVSKKKYYSLKGMMPPNIVPVGVLVEDKSCITTIVAYDNVLIHLQDNSTRSKLKDFDVNKLKHKICFAGFETLLEGSCDPHPKRRIKTKDIPDGEYSIFGFKREDSWNKNFVADMFSSNLERVMRASASCVTMYGYLEGCPEDIESIFYRSYKSYSKQLSPRVFQGELKIKSIVKTVQNRKGKFIEHVSKLHSKSGIVADRIECNGGADLTAYTLCYCFVRL